MKKYVLIVILLISSFLSSCTVLETNDNVQVTFTDVEGTIEEVVIVVKGFCVVKPIDPVREGYIFLYWMYSDRDEQFDFGQPINDNTVIIAKWEKSEFHMHSYTKEIIEPTCTEQGYILFSCVCKDSYQEDFKNPLGHDLVFHEKKDPTVSEIGWCDYYTCNRCDYTTYKEIPAIGVSGVLMYEKDGVLYVELGKYPQSHVSGQNLINSLNSLNEPNENGYYEYEGCEYAKVVATPRYYGSSKYTYRDGVVIQNKTVEWFLVQPIVWRVLNISTNNEYLLISEYILDSYKFSNRRESEYINNEYAYPNNYKHSDIRKFLNTDFLNKAFNLFEQNLMIIHEVNNTISSTESNFYGDIYNSYVCDNTNDQIFLLSYMDMLNENFNFSENNAAADIGRVAKVTDYNKAVGIEYDTSSGKYMDNAAWWLRSPSRDTNFGIESDEAAVVTSIGRLNKYFVYNLVGVRPTIIITI